MVEPSGATPPRFLRKSGSISVLHALMSIGLLFVCSAAVQSSMAWPTLDLPGVPSGLVWARTLSDSGRPVAISIASFNWSRGMLICCPDAMRDIVSLAHCSF